MVSRSAWVLTMFQTLSYIPPVRSRSLLFQANRFVTDTTMKWFKRMRCICVSTRGRTLYNLYTFKATRSNISAWIHTISGRISQEIVSNSHFHEMRMGTWGKREKTFNCPSRHFYIYICVCFYTVHVKKETHMNCSEAERHWNGWCLFILRATQNRSPRSDHHSTEDTKWPTYCKRQGDTGKAGLRHASAEGVPPGGRTQVQAAWKTAD